MVDRRQLELALARVRLDLLVRLPSRHVLPHAYSISGFGGLSRGSLFDALAAPCPCPIASVAHAMSRFLRTSAADEDAHASNLELFYDLVFVLAVTQVSHLLLDDLTWGGAATSLLVLLVIWWAWNYTTWVTNMLDPDAIVVRLLVLALMFGEPRDGGRDPRCVRKPRPALRRGVRRDPGRPARRFSRSSSPGADSPERAPATHILTWFVASGVFWLAGALASDATRIALWLSRS